MTTTETDETYFFPEEIRDDELHDGWMEFQVTCHESGSYSLDMCYASPYSNPCRIRVGEQELWVSVACGTTISDTPVWFDQEATFDIKEEEGTTKIGFKCMTGTWPNIRAFRLVPKRQRQKENSNTKVETQRARSAPGVQSRGAPALERSFVNKGLKSSKGAVTFTFEIGVSSLILAQQHNVEYVDSYLGGKAIKFQFGEAHDSLTIDGDPIGDQHGGDKFPYVSFVDENDLISCVTMGLSSWTEDEISGFAAFTGLILEKKGKASSRPIVGASLIEPTWTFDRRRMGLNLWITSLCAPIHKPVSRYGFTLSSDDCLDFNPEEFKLFWDWLVLIKYKMTQQKYPYGVHNASLFLQKVEQEAVRLQMAPLYNFLLMSFANPSTPSQSMDGYLYGTNRHVSITFDVFSIYIYRLPDGETFQSTLFVGGKQFDTQRTRLEEMRLTRNEILGYAISVALKDTDLLFQMGLIQPQDARSDENLDTKEVELLPLRSGTDLFRGNFCETIMARRVVTILAASGLRKITFDSVLEDKDGWDIYDVGAGAATVYKTGKQTSLVSLSVVVCGLIQVVLPVFLIYRGLTQETEDLTWDVYLARLFFGLYTIFLESTTWEDDNGDRITGWLCFLPEFNTTKLILGMLTNKVSMLATDVAIVVLMIRSFSVADVTLNALALYFLLEVDDNLVNERDMEIIRRYQRKGFFIIKSKTALQYRLSWFKEEDMPEITDLPSWYFVIASKNVSTLAIALLAGGCVWMILEPWVLGWSAF